MKLAKVYLIGFGLLSIAFGVGYLFSPGLLAEPAGLTDLSPAATTDIRASYGGFQIGVGAYLLWAAGAQERLGSALLLAALSIGSVFTSRLLGVLMDGDLSDFHLSGLIVESVLTISSLLALKRVGLRPSEA